MDYTKLLELLKPLFEAYVGGFGPAVQAVVMIGSLRLAFKPIFSAIEKYVYDSESKADDEVLGKIKGNIIVKGFVFVLDWVASVKLPK